MNYTVTVYMTIDAKNNEDAQAFADEVKERIEYLPDSKYGELYPDTVNTEVEEEDE